MISTRHIDPLLLDELPMPPNDGPIYDGTPDVRTRLPRRLVRDLPRDVQEQLIITKFWRLAWSARCGGWGRPFTTEAP